MSDDFVLHELLVKETHQIVDWPLCQVRLMDDATYPWLVLVPRLAGVADLDELDDKTLKRCMREVAAASRNLKALTKAQKMNVASLGNLCPQLHIHVIARFRDDPAWPGPVWGKLPRAPYPGEKGVLGGLSVKEVLGRLRSSLGTRD
ncbi:MAG: HIT family protein [Pseudomonadota bacterium]